jgi:hypothetical protein
MDDWLHSQFGITSLDRLIAFLCILLLLVIAAWKKKEKSKSVPFITWLVPAWFHIFFFTWLFLGGFYTENKWMVIAGCINLILGFLFHSVALKKNTLTPLVISK